MGDGYRIGTDQFNIKLDTEKFTSLTEQWYISLSLNAIYTYNDNDYSPPRLCKLRHKIGNPDQYNKWKSQSSTTPVSGYEAKINCATNVNPIYVDILC